MRLAQVLGAIGRALISAGVIVLLFVAYQLWGTGVQHQQAQNSLEDDFLEILADTSLQEQADQVNQVTVEVPDQEESSQESDSRQATLIETNLNDLDVSPEFISALYPEPGESLARIVIPDIDVDQISVEGVSVEDLRKGPGHYSKTPNPGQAGNAAIAGHRTTYGAPFHRIDELKPGQQIIVTTIQGTFEYRVTENQAPDGSIKGHFIVSPPDVWVLGQETGKNLLTLTACHPKYSARQRIIVQAELVGDPAPTIPREEATDLAPIQLQAGERDEMAAGEQDLAIDNLVGEDDPELADEQSSAADPAQASDEMIDDPTQTAAVGDGAGGSDTSPQVAAASDAPEQTEDQIELTSGTSGLEEGDFGEGLNGDPTKVKPAIMWGLAGGAIWLASWFIGLRTGHKWVLYLIGLFPFAPTLWSCFVNIDQALPSY